jgi:pimeloyl-ACP methyl ester carboxylesterase
MNSQIITKPTFDTAGPHHLPALVLVHGSTVTRHMWWPQLRGLAESYHVIAPDLPGHGALAQIPFTLAAAERVIAEIITQETSGSALVAGLSLGGYIAIQLAENHPNLVTGLVLSGCSINFLGFSGLYLKIMSRLIQIGWLQPSRAQAEQKVRQMFPRALSAAAEAQIQAGVFPESLGSSFAELAGKDFTTSLARYPGPGLILNGEKDKISRKREKQFVSAMLKGQLKIIPNAGHACSMDQPEAFNQAVRDFGQSIGWLRRECQ